VVVELRYLNSHEVEPLWRYALFAQVGCAVTALSVAPALAEGVTFEDVSREHSTVAARANQRDYDNRKKFGAERVVDRDRPEFQPLGINAGNYVILPAINILTHYDDNVFSSANGAQGGWRFETAPSVTFSSRLPRHVLDLTVSGRHVEFSHSEQEAITDGSLYVRGRLDIDHAQAFYGHALASLQHEELGTAEVDRDTRDPIEFMRNRAEFGFVRDAGKLALRVGVKAEEFDYNDVDSIDGGSIDQDFRDTITYSANLKLTYRFSPGYDLNTQFRVKKVDNAGNDIVDRDALGYDVLTGVNFEFSPLLRAYVAAGFEHQNFKQENFEDLNAFVYKGELQWLPTHLMTISLGAERYSSVTGFGSASTRIDTIVDGKLDYEIWRNLIFSGTAKYVMSDFRGTGREDETLLAGAQLEYLANRNLRLTARYGYRERTSSVEEFNYQGSTYMLGLSLKY